MTISTNIRDREYEKFFEDSEGNTVVRVSGQSSSSASSTFALPFADLDEIGTITYIGTSDTSNWAVKKLIDSSPDLAMTYATVVNNPSNTTYASAWANRLTLVYSAIEDI